MATPFIRACTALAICALSACAPGPRPNGDGITSSPTSVVSVSVGPCFGFCPVYDVAFDTEGVVRFSGERHTAVLGKRERKGDPATSRALHAELRRFRPAAGTTAIVECTNAVSDTSSYKIIWTEPDGGQTTATAQRGCAGGPGRDLGAILESLPQRLGIAEWAQQTTRSGEPRG